MRLAALLIVCVAVLVPATPGAAAPEGQLTWAVHISLAPTWFDPAETPGIGTPFMILYALHDALVKPMPGTAIALSLAESWSASKDGLVSEFVLRQGVRFHNGEPVTSEDVKFSFERYRGAAAAGIRVKLRPIERASYFKGWSDKKYKGLIHGASGAFGNAATRIEAFVAGGGTYVYGSYADIDGLFREQATELDPKRREATLHRIQQLIHEKVIVAPIWLNAALAAQGPRVEESGFGLIAGFLWTAPYEDLKLKGK